VNRPTKHIAIVGAGPAGVVAAISLARRGHQVTLVERSIFPRDKVCGECLSATGVFTLARVGAQNVIASLAPSRLIRSRLVAPDNSMHVVELPKPMWGISRCAMDTALVDHARSLGVDVRQPCICESVDDRSVTLRGIGKLQVDLTLVADGKALQNLQLDQRPVSNLTTRVSGFDDLSGSSKTSDIVRQQMIVTPNGKRLGSTGDFGIKTHFTNVAAESQTIELVGFGHGRGYAGLAPIENGRWNVAWSVPRSTITRYGKDFDQLFFDHVASHPRLKSQFANATRTSEWLVCPLPRFAVAGEWPAGVIPLGNAAAALEPVGGEGMGLAMRSAELAAIEIDEAWHENREIDFAALRSRFSQLWRTRIAACRATALLIEHERFAPIALTLARRLPIVARLGMRLVGK